MLSLDAFIDERDSDRRLVLTPLQLLAGCALPYWVYAYMDIHLNISSMHTFSFLPHLGWITVGVLDGVSAAVGSTLGRGTYTWPGSRRTLVGSAAGVSAAIACSWAVLLLLQAETETETDKETETETEREKERERERRGGRGGEESAYG